MYNIDEIPIFTTLPPPLPNLNSKWLFKLHEMRLELDLTFPESVYWHFTTSPKSVLEGPFPSFSLNKPSANDNLLNKLNAD